MTNVQASSNQIKSIRPQTLNVVVQWNNTQRSYFTAAVQLRKLLTFKATQYVRKWWNIHSGPRSKPAGHFLRHAVNLCLNSSENCMRLYGAEQSPTIQKQRETVPFPTVWVLGASTHVPHCTIAFISLYFWWWPFMRVSCPWWNKEKTNSYSDCLNA